MAGIGDIAKKAKVKYEDAAATIEGIRQLILEGVKITIQDFGTFDIDARDSKEARNVSTNEVIQVGEKSVPKFRFNYTFRKKVEESVPVDAEKLNKKREKKDKYYAKIAEKAGEKATPAKASKKK